MEYVIVKSTRRKKTIRIDCAQDGKLQLTFPWRTSDATIQKYIAQNSEKLHTYRSKILSARQNVANQTLKFEQGERVLFLGKSYYIDITDDKNISLCGDKLRFPQAFLPTATDKLTAWYRSIASTVIIPRASELARQFGFEFADAKLSNARTMWGFCKSSNAIRLSWRLIMISPAVCDYVILHELCHTRQHNHSAKFWQEVASVCPDWKRLRKQLRTEYNWVVNCI
ncbi:MAG: SprT family zinc-dependent metalloprotease [Clostridia bacterium]